MHSKLTQQDSLRMMFDNYHLSDMSFKKFKILVYYTKK